MSAAHKRLIRQRQHESVNGGGYPLPAGKPETRNVFGKIKRWNIKTGKYDLSA